MDSKPIQSQLRLPLSSESPIRLTEELRRDVVQLLAQLLASAVQADQTAAEAADEGC
jgi:hypothetical protein